MAVSESFILQVVVGTIAIFIVLELIGWLGERRRMSTKTLSCPKTGRTENVTLLRNRNDSKWLRVVNCSAVRKVDCAQTCMGALNWDEACQRGDVSPSDYFNILCDAPTGDVPFIMMPTTHAMQTDINEIAGPSSKGHEVEQDEII